MFLFTNRVRQNGQWAMVLMVLCLLMVAQPTATTRVKTANANQAQAAIAAANAPHPVKKAAMVNAAGAVKPQPAAGEVPMQWEEVEVLPANGGKAEALSKLPPAEQKAMAGAVKEAEDEAQQWMDQMMEPEVQVVTPGQGGGAGHLMQDMNKLQQDENNVYKTQKNPNSAAYKSAEKAMAQDAQNTFNDFDGGETTGNVFQPANGQGLNAQGGGWFPLSQPYEDPEQYEGNGDFAWNQPAMRPGAPTRPNPFMQHGAPIPRSQSVMSWLEVFILTAVVAGISVGGLWYHRQRLGLTRHLVGDDYIEITGQDDPHPL